jgi:outer membrane protein OmpA-like peptidoglycan-associated protein
MKGKQMIFGRKNVGTALILFTAVLLLVACGGKQLKVEPISKSENPIDLVNQLGNDLKNARDNQVDILAPGWFAKAEESFLKARKRLDAGDEISEILLNVSYGRAELLRAEEMAQLSKTALREVIKSRDEARAAGAESLGGDYIEVEEQFLEMTRAIEDNNLDWAHRNKEKVNRSYRQLELQAIKKHNLEGAGKLIRQAEKDGARKIAPKTLALAQEILREADAYISEHRSEKENVQKRGRDAFFEARRLLNVTKQSQKFQTMEPEEITLWVEKILYRTTRKLTAPDRRDEAFDTQVEKILDSIGALQNDYELITNKVAIQQAEMETMQKQIALLEERARELQDAEERLAREEKGTRERLEAERRFQQVFHEIQAEFEPTEAEVFYKQGDRLFIRLKAIQFPVGKDIIMPRNYPLLSKVQRAILAFDEPNVLIEGHTDSTGSEAMNEELSERRAQAVREYFVANGTLPQERIIADGYGSRRPLAPNETEEGRAINRRIDVVISPSQKAR